MSCLELKWKYISNLPSHGLFWMSYWGASSHLVGFTPLCKRLWVKGLLLVPWCQCPVLVSAHRNTLLWWPASAPESELEAGDSDINTAGWIFQFAMSRSLPAPWCLCMVWVCHSKGTFSPFNGDMPPFHGKNIMLGPSGWVFSVSSLWMAHFWAY